MELPPHSTTKRGSPDLSGRGTRDSKPEGFSPGALLAKTQLGRTFLVTSVTAARRSIFQTTSMARLLADVLQEYRRQRKFSLHEFIVMPDHFHLLLTPSCNVSLEKAVQFIKGGFSYRARKELNFSAEVWEKSFANHRIRDEADYERHREYIWKNPAKRFLVRAECEYRYSSPFPGTDVDPAPPWLKPLL